MGPNKKFIYLGLLFVTGGAFLVDRLFLDEPETATAQTAPAPAAGSAPPRPRQAAQTESQEAADPSLNRLDELDEVPAPRDVFSPSVPMLMHYKLLQDADGEQGEQTGSKPGSPEAFEEQYELQGTFVSQGALLAVVNGRVLRLGDTVDGLRLAKIEPYRAEFRRGRHRVSLSMPMPAAPE